MPRRRRDDGPYFRTLRETERRMLTAAISRAGGSTSAAARALGISRSYLWKRCRSLDVALQNATLRGPATP